MRVSGFYALFAGLISLLPPCVLLLVTEEEIGQTICDVVASRDANTILIAHRFSTILGADSIYVLERGNTLECRRHEKLLPRKARYYAMWRQ